MGARFTGAAIVAALLLGGLGLEAAARPAPGEPCRVDPSISSVRVASQDGTYDVLVHVPARARAGMPLVFNLHGSTQSGSAHRDDGAFDRAADRFGYVVAYPDGGVPDLAPRPPAPVVLPAGYFWNIPGVPLVGDVPVPPGSRDDVRFIADAIDAFAGAVCIDRSQVFVTGASGGGRMASHLACALTARVRAIAPVIGVRAGNPDETDERRPDPETCRPSRPIPVLALHGMRDTTNPYDGGGAKYWRYSVPVAMARWAELNGCARRGRDQRVTASVTRQRWVGCRNGSDVELLLSTVLGHTWPGSDSTTTRLLAPTTGPSDLSFRGNELILSFFDRFRR